MKMSHIVVWMALFFGSVGLVNAAQTSESDSGSCDQACIDAFIEMEQSQYEEC